MCMVGLRWRWGLNTLEVFSGLNDSMKYSNEALISWSQMLKCGGRIFTATIEYFSPPARCNIPESAFPNRKCHEHWLSWCFWQEKSISPHLKLITTCLRVHRYKSIVQDTSGSLSPKGEFHKFKALSSWLHQERGSFPHCCVPCFIQVTLAQNFHSIPLLSEIIYFQLDLE